MSEMQEATLEYDDSAEFRNDGGGKPRARRATSDGMTMAQKRKERAKLIEVATQMFCADISYDGHRLSIEECVDRGSILMWRAGEKVEEMYGKKAPTKLP